MHTSAILAFALALTSHAFPIAQPSLNTTVQRRSPEYDVVNVGGIPSPPNSEPAPPAVIETVIETVTAPGTPPQTVTVTIPQTSTPSPSSSSALWTTSTPSITPTPTAVPGEEETLPSGFTAMDRLARAFGKSIDAHLRARGGASTADLKARGNVTTAYSQLSARGVNGTTTEHAQFARGLNVTETGTASLKARGWNGTVLKA
ncbi:hypothetical protein BDW59DRAFT_144584 [Aspergillus cavernicola]|uniref:Uncharacterized protein n=1 Tax=Aspergillus cavernicola TaxID=176166 RepID=A0ABR4IH03_9EURO